MDHTSRRSEDGGPFMELYDIGLIGLTVMGQNLVLNIERNGFRVAVYNRMKTTTDAFMKEPAAEWEESSKLDKKKRTL
jgi:6-phosphogluconate dehydrogenase